MLARVEHPEIEEPDDLDPQPGVAPAFAPTGRGLTAEARSAEARVTGGVAR